MSQTGTTVHLGFEVSELVFRLSLPLLVVGFEVNYSSILPLHTGEEHSLTARCSELNTAIL